MRWIRKRNLKLEINIPLYPPSKGDLERVNPSKGDFRELEI